MLYLRVSRPFQIIFSALVLVTSTSCISISSLQTARTNEQGKFTGGVALGTIGLRFLKQSSASDGRALQRTIEKVRIPVIEGALRYGFLDRMDGGLRLALIPGSYGLDIKRQLSGFDQAFATALGFAIDRTGYSSSSGDYSFSVDVTDFYIPFYMSHDFAELTSVYFNPRFGMRLASVKSSESGSASSTTPFYGAALGFAHKWFIAEYSFVSMSGTESAVLTDQISLGIRISTGNLKKWEKHTSDKQKADSTPSETERAPPLKKKKNR